MWQIAVSFLYREGSLPREGKGDPGAMKSELTGPVGLQTATMRGPARGDHYGNNRGSQHGLGNECHTTNISVGIFNTNNHGARAGRVASKPTSV